MQSGGATHNCQGQNRANSRSAPRIVADTVTRLEIRLESTFGCRAISHERSVREVGSQRR
jgi:hypothetical protein